LKNPTALFALVSGIVVVLPGWADPMDEPLRWAPATDAVLSGVNQRFDVKKVLAHPAVGETTAASGADEAQGAIEKAVHAAARAAPYASSVSLSGRQAAPDVPRPPPAVLAIESHQEIQNKQGFLKVVAQSPHPLQGEDVKAVEHVIERWSKAWSAQNVPTYLSQYSLDFQQSGASDLTAWANQRTSRLVRPKFIVLTLQDVRIDLISSGLMRVRFRQSYQSDLYSDAVSKQLDLEKTVEGWKILRETVLP
jgi:hypothetical protein